jgi:hypothetical protein
MANQLNETELRRFALVGAEARLLQITEEAATIQRLFPELRQRTQAGRTSSSGKGREREAATEPATAKRGRKRSSMTAAQRKAVSDRMSKYWAARRKATGQASAKAGSSGVARAASTRASAGKAKRGPRKMSADARRRISEAQKARWAKHRSTKKTS